MLLKQAKGNFHCCFPVLHQWLALKMGIELNMTIVGFARGQRMNVYTGKERIIW